MIVITLSAHGLVVDGHAAYAKNGNDIVCAAVSVLTQNLINSIEALTEDQIRHSLRDGHIDIEWKNLSDSGKLLVDSFFLGVSAISATYGREYVNITVPNGR